MKMAAIWPKWWLLGPAICYRTGTLRRFSDGVGDVGRSSIQLCLWRHDRGYRRQTDPLTPRIAIRRGTEDLSFIANDEPPREEFPENQ